MGHENKRDWRDLCVPVLSSSLFLLSHHHSFPWTSNEWWDKRKGRRKVTAACLNIVPTKTLTHKHLAPVFLLFLCYIWGHVCVSVLLCGNYVNCLTHNWPLIFILLSICVGQLCAIRQLIRRRPWPFILFLLFKGWTFHFFIFYCVVQPLNEK